MTSPVSALLDDFASLCAPGDPAFTVRRARGGGGPRLAFAALIHGDEVGPLPAFVRLARRLVAGQLPFEGEVSLVLGNPEAALAGRRYLDSDLNRAFGDSAPPGREGRRAAALRPLLDEVDLFLDFHQVSQPCLHAFWTLPWGREAARWVRALRGAPAWVTRAPGQGFTAEGLCADERVRARGAPGLTLELGQRGWDVAQSARVVEVVERCVALAGAARAREGTLAAAAAAAPPLRLLETVHREPFGDPRRALRPGLKTFQAVRGGEALHAPGAPPLHAPSDGLLLFPKYPQRDEAGLALGTLPGELYHLARPLTGDPAARWG